LLPGGIGFLEELIFNVDVKFGAHDVLGVAKGYEESGRNK
jgi:hypothetical protein